MIVDEIADIAKGDINNIYKYILDNSPEAYNYISLCEEKSIPYIAVAVAIAVREQSHKIRSLEPSLN